MPEGHGVFSQEHSVLPADRPADENGVQYHIALQKGQIPAIVLMPGDPARIDRIKKYWSDAEELASHREFRSARGLRNGVAMGAVSVGVGMGGVEVAMNELATIGTHTIIRVGTTGSLRAEMQCGDLIIPVAAVRREGVSDIYAEKGFPAFAHPEVTMALVEACQRLHLRYHLGIGCSTGSFFLGQGRPTHNGYFNDDLESILPTLNRLGVSNLDMETAGVFVLGHLMGVRAGSILAVRANRATNELRDNGGEDAACLAACEAAAILYEQDEARKKSTDGPVSSTLAQGPK
jgi:uridine phosphorylase